MSRSACRLALALAALSACLLLRSSAHADPIKCNAAIIKAAGNAFRNEAKAVQKCEAAKLAGKLAANTVCANEVKTDAALAKANAGLQKSVAAKCGGKDKMCALAGDDDSLNSIGWEIGQCPNFGFGSCAQTIADCSGIAGCLSCIDGATTADGVSPTYATFTPTDPKTKDKSVKALRKCQATIGKASAAYLTARSKALGKCWAAVNKASGKRIGIAAACPDAKTVATLAAADQKRATAITKACQGPDKKLGTADDVTPAEIGFDASCPDVTTPLARACAHPVATLQDLITCDGCLDEFHADCADRAAIPAFAPYPPLCNVVADCANVPGNLVQNCGFESPTVPTNSYDSWGPGSTGITGWTVVASPAGGVDQTTAGLAGGFPVHSGAQSVDLNHDNPGGVSQDVPTAIGHAYKLIFLLSGYPGSAAPCFAADPKTVTAQAGATSRVFDFSPDGSASPPGNQRFVQETMDFTATGSTTTITFSATSAGCAGPVIDDVVVVPSGQVACAIQNGSLFGHSQKACSDLP